MEYDSVIKVLAQHPWSIQELNEAARGLVQGSCDDPPEVQLKEMARFECGGETAVYMERQVALVSQALNGEFDG